MTTTHLHSIISSHLMSIFSSLLVLASSILHVLISSIGDSTTDQENGVQADTEAGGRAAGGRGALLVDAGDRVARLALQIADIQAGQGLTGLVAVADILEGFGCVLAADVQKDFLTTRVLIDEAGAVVDLVVDDQVEVLLGVVAGDLVEGELFAGHFDGYLITQNKSAEQRQKRERPSEAERPAEREAEREIVRVDGEKKEEEELRQVGEEKGGDAAVDDYALCSLSSWPEPVDSVNQ